MAAHYNPLLVFASLCISVLSSWVALDLSARVHLQGTKREKAFWLVGGSLAMGIGIWSMHYIGMLAYRMQMPVLYDWPTVLGSMLSALVASGIALGLVVRQTLPRGTTVAGGVAMGTAIASMHYIGMAAMRMPMRMDYVGSLVVLSVIAAVIISTIGIRLTFASREIVNGWSVKKAWSALLMGLAIPTMHYTGMAAARWTSGPGNFTPHDLEHAISISTLATTGIVLVSILLLAIALVFASIDRHVSHFRSALHGSDQSYTQLKKHHERLQGAFRSGGFGIWECDPATGLFYVDAGLRALYAIPQDGLPVSREVWKASVHPDDVAGLDQHWSECLARSDQYENEYRILRPNQEVRRVRSVASLIRTQDGSLQRVLGMTWDVTADRQREQESRDQASRFRLTLEAIVDAVIATDKDLRIVFINPAASNLTGWKAHEAVGRSLGEVLRTHEELTGALRSDPVQRCIDGLRSDLAQGSVENRGSFLAERGLLISRTGQRYNIRQHVALMDQGRGAVITFQDITAACGLEMELLYAATHDSLTGLANRAAFEKQLATLWEETRQNGRYHCLCVLDLDRFKIINDAVGHIAGDALLRQSANLLQAALRPTDLVGRMGGDEFMLLLPDTRTEEAGSVLRALLVRIGDQHFQWRDKIYNVTASIGMVPFDRSSPDPDELLSRADAALFTAKRYGRDQIAVFSDEGSAADHLLEMQIAADLRRCIEEDCFELHAQPIVPSGSIDDARCFEVLLRMRGKDGMLISPALFIPAAERFDMMAMVDRWVIRNTLMMYRQSDAAKAHLQLAINLSAESLSDPSLWNFVSEQFSLTGVDPASITFEVTETGIIRNLDMARGFMKRCRQAGSRIALDDFGTGLSSLSYLKQFPFDIIKIDGSFIRNLLNSSLDQTIVRSIGEIARSLGATTIAECVEDTDTLEVLRNLDVDWIQGWVTGRPTPLSAVIASAKEAQTLAKYQQLLPRIYAAKSSAPQTLVTFS